MRSLRLKFSFFRSLRCWDRVRYPLDMVGNPWGGAHAQSPPQPRNVVQLHRGMKRAGGDAARLRRHAPDGWRSLPHLGLGSLLWVLERSALSFFTSGDICGIPDRGTCCVNSDTSGVTRLQARTRLSPSLSLSGPTVGS